MLLKVQIGQPGHTVPSSNVKYPIFDSIQFRWNAHGGKGQTSIKMGVDVDEIIVVVWIQIGQARQTVPWIKKSVNF